MIKVLDLFSGIGGFSLGLERTGGFKTVAFCEIEDYPRKVLAKHWPDVPIFPDVRELTVEDLPDDIGLICGGYPCQPFSVAGKREGAGDDRHLWPEVARLVSEIRPDWCFFENVAGHITLGLDQVLSDLEGLGYTAEAFAIPAVALDAPHRRDRVWLVAYPEELQLNGCEHNPSAISRSVSESGGGSGAGTVAHPNITRLPQRKGQDSGRERENGWAKPERGVCWGSEPPVGRVANGVPSRVDRLKALGNAVVPQIPEIIGRAILEAAA